MGLRFRKSVTLCKGVRLNFGKTGTSVSVGGHGYRKTFHSSGRVTTSVGIPGTGIYWTDSKNPKSKKNARPNKSTMSRNSVAGANTTYLGEVRDYSLDRTIPAENVDYNPTWLTETSDDDMESSSYEMIDNHAFFADESRPDSDLEDSNTPNDSTNESYGNYLTEDYIRNIYVQCDDSIDWGEILAGTSADDLLMDNDFWLECKKYCSRIMRGDVDAYLEVIEEFRPVDDILLYAGEFEFGTDASSYIETEFRLNADEMVYGGVQSPLFEEFVYAVSVRVARDLMALLPVRKVVIHVVHDGITFFSAVMDKGQFAECDFRREPIKSIITHTDCESGIEKHSIHEVSRKAAS